MVDFISLPKISIKSHPELNELWVQDRIAEATKMLGLGDLDLLERERRQPKAGRLDLLLRDPDTLRRYEVEIQLGQTDESHIIRTIEYWDIERKRYPQYDHCAVIVAEDITTRFLNVINLFNGMIPFIAIQMTAVDAGDNKVSLFFTRVLDEINRGLVDDDEIANEVADRPYWENKATPQMVALADQILELVNETHPGFELKYNKFYIGIAQDGQPMNFVLCRPRKTAVIFEAKLPRSEDVDTIIDDAELDALNYDSKWNQYRVRLKSEELETKKEAISRLIELAYQYRVG